MHTTVASTTTSKQETNFHWSVRLKSSNNIFEDIQIFTSTNRISPNPQRQVHEKLTLSYSLHQAHYALRIST